MLDVYTLMLKVLGMLKGALTQIERHDKDLGSQLRRAASSVALNIPRGRVLTAGRASRGIGRRWGRRGRPGHASMSRSRWGTSR